MRVVIALDSFKGSLTALEAGATVAAALARLRPTWEVRVVPLADGGEGTAETLVTACRGRLVQAAGVAGPLARMRLTAGFGWLPDSRVAVVEMAQASGLPLLTVGQRDPLRTTTLGTGQLLDAAARLGPAKILLGLGGSATVDGGTGAARALGWCFLDRHGRALPWGGGALARLSRIVRPTPPLALPPVEALCDVRNPLCGPQGAAAVFGPQKGATPEMVVRLDEGLANLAECIRRDLGMDVSHLPGSGAAGGFGAGAVAFLGARIVPGIDTIAAVAGLPEALRAADWVVTGEGCLDSQSLQGKVVSGVLGLALSARVRVAVLAGRVRLTPGQWRAAGIQSAVAAAPTSVSEAEAMAHATELLAGAAGRLVPELES